MLLLCCYGKVLNFMTKNTGFIKKHYITNPCMTDLSDYKKISVVLENRQVFDEHYIFIYLSQTKWSIEHTYTQKLFLVMSVLLAIGWSYCASSWRFVLVAWRNNKEKVILSGKRRPAYSVTVRCYGWYANGFQFDSDVAKLSFCFFSLLFFRLRLGVTSRGLCSLLG